MSTLPQPPAQPRKRVLVFAEHGADSRTLCAALRDTFNRAAAPVDVIPVTAAQMREPGMMDPARTAAFFLPGASDADYDRKLGPENIAALRRYVNDGGRFMGICAGAYYACRKIDWYEWDPERAKRKTPGIDFFDYHAQGPMREFIAHGDRKTALDRSLAHAAVADITHETERGRMLRARVLYWGGPRLDGHAPGTVLARFNGVAGNPPAVVMRRIGRGTAIISSIHPEIRGADFRAAVYGEGPLQDRARGVGEHLARREKGRAALWDDIMKRLFPEFIR